MSNNTPINQNDPNANNDEQRQLNEEIQEITKLFNTRQFDAALARIEEAQRKFPNNLELISVKLRFFRASGKTQLAFDVAKSLVKEFPNDTIAICEYILSAAACGYNKEAIGTLVNLCENFNSNDNLNSYVLFIAFELAYYFILQNAIAPAIGISYYLSSDEKLRDNFESIIASAYSKTDISFTLRSLNININYPDNFPAKKEFDLAMEQLSKLRWNEALATLISISKHADVWIQLQKNIAVIQYWMFEIDEACNTLKSLIANPQLDIEDAADAEMLRLEFNKNLLGEPDSALLAEYQITDVNSVHEKLLSSQLAVVIPYDLSTFSKLNQVPPKGIFKILTRPAPPEDIELTAENIPYQLAICFLFGKETDKNARIEIASLRKPEQKNLEIILKQILGDLLITNFAKTQTAENYVRSTDQLFPKFVLPPNREINAETQNKLYEQYYENVFAPQWLNYTFESLGNNTPIEAVKNPSYRARTLGLVNFMEQNIDTIIENWSTTKFANILRQKLGFQLLDTIQVPEENEKEQLNFLNNLPITRWHRIDVKKLSNNVLTNAFMYVAIYNENKCNRIFAEEILNRPITEIDSESRLLAYDKLIKVKNSENKLEESLKLISKAKNEAVLSNSNDAIWYMHEIPIRLVLNQHSYVEDAIKHVITRHGSNEKIMRDFYMLLAQLGLIQPKEKTPDDEKIAAQNASNQKTTELWTPDNINSNNTQPTEQTKSKLWTPD
ncbi:MAG: hypothetical protein LBB88_07465 [Planctomycetaceae bacterium]|jgi:hypothetical protein|nr:hypothetical protein [Planctomycetaceae bacterium]